MLVIGSRPAALLTHSPSHGSAMKKKAEWEAILEELKDACGKVGITLRETTKIRSRGALCTVHGKRVLIVNRLLDPEDKVDLIAEEMRDEDFSQVFLKPHLRELLERA
jgi:hypothetical protein